MNHSIEYNLIGIETRDILVYEALLRSNDRSIRSLSRMTTMNRGTVYESIKKLCALGMVTFRDVGERRYYQPADPEILFSLIDERRQALRQLSYAAGEHIQQLRTLYERDKNQFFVQAYEGDEGVAAILRDVLKVVSELEDKQYAVFASQRVTQFLYHNFPGFSKQRIKRNIFARVISDAPAGEPVILAERRQLTGDSAIDGYEIIYGQKVAHITMDDTNVMSGVILTDQGISRMQANIFNAVWETL